MQSLNVIEVLGFALNCTFSASHELFLLNLLLVLSQFSNADWCLLDSWIALAAGS
jgi:hypothetical protein